jgi:hypothetical protein
MPYIGSEEVTVGQNSDYGSLQVGRPLMPFGGVRRHQIAFEQPGFLAPSMKGSTLTSEAAEIMGLLVVPALSRTERGRLLYTTNLVGTCAWRLLILGAGGPTDVVLDVLSKYRPIPRRSHSVCKAHPTRLGD